MQDSRWRALLKDQNNPASRIIHFTYFYLQNLFPSTTSDHEFTSANFRTYEKI